eukprot:scaffold30581_cov105-Phaeocystis_antarctica.AAC.4
MWCCLCCSRSYASTWSTCCSVVPEPMVSTLGCLDVHSSSSVRSPAASCSAMFPNWRCRSSAYPHGWQRAVCCGSVPPAHGQRQPFARAARAQCAGRRSGVVASSERVAAIQSE